MFICEKCLTEKYDNFALSTSLGKCEICDTKSRCADIPSKYLNLKPKVDDSVESEEGYDKSNVLSEIELIKKNYQRQLKRVSSRLKNYDGMDLSISGHWSKGYFTGIQGQILDIMDDLEDIINKHK